MSKKKELLPLIVDYGQLMQKCAYCEILFYPTRMGVHKYHSESCRVKACRERNHGLYGITGGTNSNKRNGTTNTDLKNSVNAVMELFTEQQKQYKFDREIDLKNHELRYKEIRLQIAEDMQKIRIKQNWNMFLTVLIPIIAPVLSSWASGLFNKTETAPLDINSFLKKLDDDFGDRVTPEMKAQIILAMGSIFS